MPRIAYLIGRYPAMTPTFVQREIAALRDSGVEIDTFSIWRTAAQDLLSDADREEAKRTTSLVPVSPAAAVASLFAAVVRGPAGVAALARRAFRLAKPGLRGKFLAASWVLEALMLWRALRRRGIRHVHVHLAGTAPAVALLATEFANRGGDDERHTWSLTVHGPDEFYGVDNEALPQKLAAAEFAVCISDFGRSQLMAFTSPDDWPKLHVVHCGIDPTRISPRRAGADTSDSTLNVLTVAKLTPRKGVAVLLEAVQALGESGVDARLTVVGDGPERAALETQARRLGIDARVEFAGAVGQDRIDAYYESADAFAMASFAEGVPVVLMEAMAHELPVVAPAIMGVGELVDDEESGLLVRPGRADLLAAALRRLAGDPELRARLGAAGRLKVESEFDVRESATRLRTLFGAVAQR